MGSETLANRGKYELRGGDFVCVLRDSSETMRVLCVTSVLSSVSVRVTTLRSGQRTQNTQSVAGTGSTVR